MSIASVVVTNLILAAVVLVAIVGSHIWAIRTADHDQGVSAQETVSPPVSLEAAEELPTREPVLVAEAV